ncbi:MAG: uracil-xanthine permease family protein [Gemmatimonadales bacterium]
MTNRATIYDIDDRPPLREAVPLGLQHLVAMLLGNITPPLLVGGAIGLATGDLSLLLQMVFLMAGIATVVQAYPVGPVGGRIPIVMGTSVAFVGASISIGTRYGIAAVLGASLVAAVIEVVLGFSITRARRLFPPLVNGVVVMLIGLTLIPVGMDYAAGGVGAVDYGSAANLGVAGIVFAVTLLLNQFGRGFVSYASMLIGIAAGYAVSLGLGVVEFAGVGEAAWLAIPLPLQLGLEFHPQAILLMGFIYVISTMETLGDITGTMAAVGREPTDAELSGGLVADGVMSGLAALFSALPNTSYSQNVGLVNFTGVVSRHVTAVAGVFLILFGITPKVGALFGTIPPAVIGGGGLIMFAMIFASGLAIVHRSVELTQRNMVILAVSLGLGLGVELRPDVLQIFPEAVRTLLGSGLVTGGLAAVVMNAVFGGEDG